MYAYVDYERYEELVEKLKELELDVCKFTVSELGKVSIQCEIIDWQLKL